MLNNLFNKRKKADEQRKKWEEAVYRAGLSTGFEMGCNYMKAMYKQKGVIIGAPPLGQIETQVEEIMRRMEMKNV